jgi:hypothetical protein
MSEVWIPVIVLLIPIVAIIGGLSIAALRMMSQHRLLELAQRERIAMIERGADPAKLPPPPDLMAMGWGGGEILRPFPEFSRRRAQNLTIGGIILFFLGVAIGVFLYYVTGKEGGPALVGLIPAALGIALLISARIVAADAEKAGPAAGSGPGTGPGTPHP